MVTYSVQRRGERKANTATNQQEKRGRGGSGQKDSRRRGGNIIKKWRIGMKMSLE